MAKFVHVGCVPGFFEGWALSKLPPVFEHFASGGVKYWECQWLRWCCWDAGGDAVRGVISQERKVVFEHVRMAIGGVDWGSVVWGDCCSATIVQGMMSTPGDWAWSTPGGAAGGTPGS